MTQTKPRIISKKIASANRHWKNFLDKDYLGAHNLEQGEEMLVTIAKFEGAEIVKSPENPKGEPKLVLYFKEDVPKMILNITNGTTLAGLYGPHPDQWIGKKIQLYAANVKAFGKQQEALRIRDIRPAAKTVTADDIRSQLQAARTLHELAAIWKAMPLAVRTNPAMGEIKDEIKSTFTTTN
jgi:hypothetical protein